MGTLSVSPTGGANYTIPIEVPPGLNGVEPDIALTFNSQSGNGLAGWGWNVSGISVITRIPSTEYHDNEVDPVDFDLKDRFALDGQRLILKSGSYGADGAYYETEKYSNIKIRSVGSHPIAGVDGPATFTVIYPDGSIAFYGFHPNSTSRTDYAIYYWENPQGIRINYFYNTVNNGLNIDKITYGARGAATPINEIKFVYGNRTRPEQTYINGVSFIKNTILEEIQVKASGGQGYRNYSLSHDDTTLGYQKLVSVQEKTGDNSSSRPAITFNYGDSGNSNVDVVSKEASGPLSIDGIDQTNHEVVAVDILGNGKMDFVVYPTDGPDEKEKFWLLSDIQDPNSSNLDTEVNTGSFENIFTTSWLNSEGELESSQGLAVVQEIGGNQVKFTVMSSGDNSPIEYKYDKIWESPSYLYRSSCTTEPVEYPIPQRYFSGDFDGDGLTDVLAIGLPYEVTYCQNEYLDCNFSNPPDPNCCECTTNNYTASQVNLIRLDRRLTNNFSSPLGSLPNALQGEHRIITLDVNGDGRTDIVQFREGVVTAYSLDASNNFKEILWETSDSRIKLEFPILPGDFNGDGKSDFMIPTANNSKNFALFLSTGIGFEKDEKQEPFEYRPIDYSVRNTVLTYNLIPVDINGDGRTDILDYWTQTHPQPNDGHQWVYLYQNKASTSINVIPEFESAGSIHVVDELNHFPIPVFLPSDRPNYNLDFATISDKWVTSFQFKKNHAVDVKLEEVANNGVVTSILYDQINPFYVDEGDPNYMPSYTPKNDQTYPFINVNMAPAFQVVRKLSQTGSGIERTKKFLYEGAVSHSSGLGFLGFQVLKQTNWFGDGVGELWNGSKHDPFLRGAVTESWTSTTYISNPSQFMTKTAYFYDDDFISNLGSPLEPQVPKNLYLNSPITEAQTKRATETITLLPGFHANSSNGTFLAEIVPEQNLPPPTQTGNTLVFDLRLEKTENDNGLTGVFTTETYNYDAYGNPLTTNTTFPAGNKSVTVQYSNNASSNGNTYHIGRPKNMTEQVTINGNAFSTESQYSYNNNLVTQVKKRGNGTPWLTEDIQHDVNGNVLQKTLSGTGVASRTESFEYGYNDRFLTKSTDIEDLETDFTYEADTGNLVTTTDPFGFVTRLEHDEWNRLKKETDYLGKNTIHNYTALNDGGLQKQTNFPEGGYNYMKFNAFGWETETGSLTLNNQVSRKTIEYDAAGRKKRQSEPYFGGASKWNTFAFDQYGRLSSQQLFNGKNITITYSGLSTTVNDGTKSVTTTLDALGNTAKVQDPGGTVNYTYYGNGTMKTADYGGHVVTVSIDGWGRKTSLHDPSAGNYTYEYDFYGVLVEEISPKGTTTYEYDAFGKPTSKEIDGDLTDLVLSYQYDASTKLVTNINGQDNTNNRAYTYQYTYDSYNRPNTVVENTGLAEFEKQYIYDTYGRVHKETFISKNLSNAYSSTVRTRRVYDTSGLVKEIWNDGTPDKLWELNGINERGQLLNVALGNGINKSKAYDSYGFLEKIEDKESGTNPSIALHMEYDFDQQRGILNSRENFGLNHQESFQYDSQDRLTTISGDVAKTMTYDAMGRITNNTSIGQYAYESGNKFRLKEITPNALGETYYEQHPTQSISYNAFKKPIDIHEAGHGRATFEYGPMMNRSHAWYGGEDQDKNLRRFRKHYSSIIPAEIVEDTQSGETKIITYIGGDAYTAPIANIKLSSPPIGDPEQDYFYLHRDYLGSILAITDSDANIVEQRQFGAWGQVDLFTNSSGGTVFNHDSLLGRGYTGHEHFFEVSLIHMNGRMYDAELGRFLSPDNFIQDSFNTQNYNRYSYVLNNPLMYTDSSGESFIAAVVAGAIIGAAVSAATYTVSAAITGNWSLKGLFTSLSYGTIAGAFSGALSGIGAFASSSAVASGGTGAFWQSSTYGILSEVASQAATSVAFGEQITTGTILGSLAGGFVSGAFPKWNGIKGGWAANAVAEIAFGSIKGGLRGAISGSIGALVDGSDFGDGLIDGAKKGGLGGFSQSFSNIAAFGATFKPSKEQLIYADKMAAAFDLSTDKMAWRKGGLYQVIIDREVVWGRNANMNSGSRPEDFGHEYGHIIQTHVQGWASFQGRGIFEQTKYTLFLMGFSVENPYRTPGNNESGADDYLHKYGGY